MVRAGGVDQTELGIEEIVRAIQVQRELLFVVVELLRRALEPICNTAILHVCISIKAGQELVVHLSVDVGIGFSGICGSDRCFR